MEGREGASINDICKLFLFLYIDPLVCIWELICTLKSSDQHHSGFL